MTPTFENRPVCAVMATFPARADTVQATVRALMPQVDKLILVLNEHTEVPAWCNTIPNLVPVLPEIDRKDVAKFSQVLEPESWIVLTDDDLIYPSDYVAHSLEEIAATGLGDVGIFGYHGTIYGLSRRGGWRSSIKRHLKEFVRNPSFHVANFRYMLCFYNALARPWRVEQLGTGTVIALGKNLMTLGEAEGSERRVDTRLASWAFRTGRPMVALPREKQWLRDTDQEVSIYSTYTVRRPRAFLNEVAIFAQKTSGMGPLKAR